jgi:CubicO group peptidase (beta-lactamase class C family)
MFAKIKTIAVIFTIILLSSIIIQSVNAKNTADINKQKINDKIFDFKMKILQILCNSPSLSACIVKNGEIAWEKSYGYSNVKTLKKATTEDIYLVGSVTKTITTTALLQLYEKEYFDLDSNVSEYLPFDLKNPNFPETNITFRMLLSHRSSIFDYCILSLKGMYETFLYSDVFDDLGAYFEESLLPDGKFYNSKYWHDYQPGVKADYSNVGFLLIGYLVERLSNMSIEEYCRENIFKPLNMTNTSYHPQNLDEEKMVTPYIKNAGIYVPLPNYDAKSVTVMGGVRTNLEDLSHFLIAHMKGGIYKDARILNESTVELMHNCIYDSEEGALLKKTYGLGWWSSNQNGKIVSGHGGMCPGGVCFMMMNESSDTGYIFFTNKFNILEFFQPIRLTIVARARNKIGTLLLEKAEEL